ncbi:sigma factor-like helix-turn-helix DNA-binding protein [Bacillus salipaludis]|uniref:sigma factor-like helix-turn-helix DNA-binding protein n=1 Tax=Bacillus salipaludis TaxID=2547811 RepID=UPI003D20C241
MVLSKYLELLNQEERQIVILKDISGMKHREIAKITEMPLGTVLHSIGKGWILFLVRVRYKEQMTIHYVFCSG